MPITFRPHHFLCAFCFQGRGYSSAFISNFQSIIDTLTAPAGDATPIKVVADTDSICSPCPNKRGTACTTQEKINQLDQAHATALAISPGETLTWGEAKSKIAKHISVRVFHHICTGCEWKEYGICESVLKTNFLE